MGRMWAVLAALPIAITACGGTTTAASETTTVTVTSTAPAQIQISTVYETPPPGPGPTRIIRGDGTFAVGTDIVPGVYRSAGTSTPGRDCYWKRLASFDSGDIIDNEGSPGPQVVEILASDAAFSTSNCLSWTAAD